MKFMKGVAVTMHTTNFIVALLLTSASAVRVPVPSLKFRLNPFTKDSAASEIGGEIQVAADITDKVSAGSVIQWGINKEDCKVESLSASASDININSHYKLKGNVKVSDDTTVLGDVELTRKDAVSVRANLNSEADGVVPYVESVQLTQRCGGWRISPTLHMKDLNMDLEAAADFDACSTMVSVDHQGKSKFAFNHVLNSETALNVNSADGLSDVTFSLDRAIGNSDMISPSYQNKNKMFNVDWTRRFKSMQMRTTLGDSAKTLALSLSGINAGWNLNMKAPINAPKDTTFSLSSDVSLRNWPSFRTSKNDDE